MQIPVLGRALAATVVLLLMTACRDDADGGGDAKEIKDVCGLLPVEDASRVVGVPYAESREPEAFGYLRLCSYRQAADSGPFTLSVSAGEGDLGDAVDGLELVGEVAQESIEVPGADEALRLTTDDGDIAVEQVVAEADGNVYVVTFGGSTDVATRLLSVVLGEEPVDHPGTPVPDACDVLADAARGILPDGVRPKRRADEAAW